MKYKVNYTGFAFVEADTPEEAITLFENYEPFYEEKEYIGVEKIDEFGVMI